MTSPNLPPPLDSNDFDIHEAGFVHDPFPAYDWLRERCPVARSQHYGGFWLLTRYDDVKQAAVDWRTYTSSVVGVTAIPIITPRTEPALPIELDPPLHSRYRALVAPVFSGERIAQLRPTVEFLAESLLDELLARGDGDLVADYAMPLSVGTLAAFTGFPRADSPKWVNWIQRMFNVQHPADRDQASRELGEYVDTLIAARKQQRTDDFISVLMDSEVDGQRLTDREIHMFCTTVFGAGFETTADGLSVMLYYLAEHPEARRRLVEQPTLIPAAVEEFLRYISPVQIFGRNTTQTVELHGKQMQPGDVVALGFGSANHDPAIFPEPERCLLDRTPNRHLAFGAGVHLCLGAPVARLEMALTLEIFARRRPDFQVRSDAAVSWKTRGDRRGLSALPIVISSC